MSLDAISEEGRKSGISFLPAFLRDRRTRALALAALLSTSSGAALACEGGPDCPSKKPRPPAVPAPAPLPGDDACGFGRTIVMLRPGVDPDDAAATFARRYQGVVCRVYRHSIRGVTLRCTGPRVVNVLAQDPLVESVEPDVRVEAYEQQVPSGVRRVGAPPPVSSERRPGPVFDIGVAVLDTGVDLAHPDIRVAGGASFVEGFSSAMDGQGHGSHCAGIIAARDDAQGVVGVVPGARVYAIKVLDDAGGGRLSDVIAGLEWVAKNADRVAVANLSLGVRGTSPSLRAAVQAAVRAGVVVVAAAGNDGADVFGADGVFGTEDDSIPAAFPEVCAVSALADSDGLPGGAGGELKSGPDDTLARFSNYAKTAHEKPFVRSPGGAIDVAAPGAEILSCWKEGTYRRVSGTSMAAPHVAGLVARMVAARGRDWNGDGKTDQADVYAIRQALVDASEPQARWRPDGATADRDALREGLATTGARPSPPAPPPPTLTGPVSRPGASPGVPARPVSAPANTVAGVSVIGVISPTGPLGTTESPSVLVGVENRGARTAAFNLVLVDVDTGRGLGIVRIAGLEPGKYTTVSFPCGAGTGFRAGNDLRAVVLAP